MTKYIGNIIKRLPTAPTESVATGIWSLQEQSRYSSKALWKTSTPLFVSYTYNVSGSSSSIVAQVPDSVKNGDLLIAFTSDGDGRTHNINAAFTSIATFSISQSGGSVQYRVANNEPASYTFTISSAGRVAVTLMLFKNLSYDSASTWATATSTVAVASSITTTNTKYLLNVTGGRNSSSTGYNAPSGFTAIANELGISAATTFPFQIVSIKDWTSGATGTSQVTTTSGSPSNNGAIHIALK